MTQLAAERTLAAQRVIDDAGRCQLEAGRG
jgi:hypothetical protein